MRTALITGVAGMDGSNLAELLLDKGYEVHGVYRRISTGNNLHNLSDAYGHPNLHFHIGDLTDNSFITSLISTLKPDYLYHLGAMSHVGQSFIEPVSTFRTNAESTINILQSIKEYSPNTRMYFASTSEMMGGLDCPILGYDEQSPLNPRSPYAVSKCAAYYAVRNYRAAYGLFVCSGILFNHSCTKRGLDFATRKITNGVAKIKSGIASHVFMGNLASCRDEGASRDYVKAMHLMLEADEPNDYVVATGVSVSIEEMFKYVCSLANLDFKDIYRQDERYMRPSDVPYLKGNPSKIKAELGWEPEYDWRSLLKEMYENDLVQLNSSS